MSDGTIPPTCAPMKFGMAFRCHPVGYGVTRIGADERDWSACHTLARAAIRRCYRGLVGVPGNPRVKESRRRRKAD